MSLFKSVDLVQKTKPGQYVEGDWIAGPEAANSFKGTAQPASGKTLELLPEGKRNSETITVFAPIGMTFTPADPLTQRSGDIIEWEGRDYEVQVAKKWNNGLLPHWELVAIRVKEGEA
jgi:hypothetical protein